MRLFNFIRKQEKIDKTVEALITEMSQDNDRNFYSVMISDLNTKSRYYYSCFGHVANDRKRSSAKIKTFSFGEDNCLHIEIL